MTGRSSSLNWGQHSGAARTRSVEFPGNNAFQGCFFLIIIIAVIIVITVMIMANYWVFTHLLYSKSCSKNFSGINSLSPHNNPINEIPLLSPFSQMRKLSQKLGKLPGVTSLTCGRTRIQTQLRPGSRNCAHLCNTAVPQDTDLRSCDVSSMPFQLLPGPRGQGHGALIHPFLHSLTHSFMYSSLGWFWGPKLKKIQSVLLELMVLGSRAV